MNLGTNLLLQHKYRESSDLYAQALAIDPHIFDRYHGPTTGAPATDRDSGELSYIKARSCARAGLTDCAIDHLRKAFDAGFATNKQVVKENDFGALRGMPEFERLLAERRRLCDTLQCGFKQTRKHPGSDLTCLMSIVCYEHARTGKNMHFDVRRAEIAS